MHYIDLFAQPHTIRVETDDQWLTLDPGTAGWGADDIEVTLERQEMMTAVCVAAQRTPLQRISLRWNCLLADGVRILGDHWERAYGDLEWRGYVPERLMPWYCLLTAGALTHGYGVQTGGAAFASWQVDQQGITLTLDVCCGGLGVRLGGRRLAAAHIITRQGQQGETPFMAAQRFCTLLCPHPRLPDHPVYGSNNWYYAYGISTHGQILRDTDLLATLAPAGNNQPYMVIDGGWQTRAHEGEVCCGAPWEGNDDFPDMPGLAAAMRRTGARPGIWVRPLGAAPTTPANRLLPEARIVDDSARVNVYDPSLPENLAEIADTMRELRGWGFELIKHDWTSCDLLGRWGFTMDTQMTNPGWRFADPSRTTAEIVLDLFAAMRAGAQDAVIIACNSFSHLGAGVFEIQRTGDDTSGIAWERTRKMGINTLAFRMPQHAAFYAVDADCVGITDAVPWELNRQWLDVLARAGTPLFVSADPRVMTPERREAVRAAFALAAEPQQIAEPLDWLDTTCPTRWQTEQGEHRYNWIPSAGVLSRM